MKHNSVHVIQAGALCVAALVGALLIGCSQPEMEGSTDSATSTNEGVATMQNEGSAAVVDAAYVSDLEDGAYLVDTRTPEEFAAGHIPGALNASYPKSTGGPCQAEENAASFWAAWEQLQVPLDAHVVLYCRTGVRAASAASVLKDAGYENVELYKGSWTDWTSDPSRPVM